MRKMLTVCLMLVFILGVPAAGTAYGQGLVIRTSNVDFSQWEWKTEAKDTQFSLITNEREARQFTRTLSRFARPMAQNALAGVDFKTEVAVVASLGETSGSFKVEIGQVNINERSVLVRVGMQSPGENDPVLLNLVHPFDLVTLPRKDMPKDDFELIVFNQHGEAVLDEWMNLYGKPEAPAKGRRHTVRTGETLWALANKYGVTIEDIMGWNKLTSHEIKIGQVLSIYA